MTFIEKLEARQRKVNSLLCVGLDSEHEKIPQNVKERVRKLLWDSGNPPSMEDISLFTEEIVAAAYPYVCAYKPNIAFFENKGADGLVALREIVWYILAEHSDIPIILDGKRGDIGNPNNGYARYAFDILGVDAVTVPPYLGEESLRPFLERKDKGIIVLCRSSNPGAREFQDMLVSLAGKEFKEAGEFFLSKGLLKINPGPSAPLYQYVAYRVAHHWNKNSNCLLVVGATYPEELKQVRQIVGDMPILVPGVGIQGGDLEAVLKNGLRGDGLGLIINASRSVIFASSGKDFAQAAGREAKKLRDLINQFREGGKNA